VGDNMVCNSKEKTERNKQIYEMRKSGMTFAAIANLMSISNPRVRAICSNQQNNEESDYPLKKLLSARLVKAFITAYGDERLLENPQMIIDEVKISDLKKVQNVGKQSIQGLIDAMIKLGYIKEGDEWLSK
jgi:hypothetical protein